MFCSFVMFQFEILFFLVVLLNVHSPGSLLLAYFLLAALFMHICTCTVIVWREEKSYVMGSTEMPH